VDGHFENDYGFKSLSDQHMLSTCYMSYFGSLMVEWWVPNHQEYPRWGGSFGFNCVGAHLTLGGSVGCVHLQKGPYVRPSWGGWIQHKF
jgi:hypothetical protein